MGRFWSFLKISCITRRVFIPFKYHPRTRPHRPIVPSLCFFSAVKRTPEEWHQTIAPMRTPLNADLGPIFGHVSVSMVHNIQCAELSSLALGPFGPHLWRSRFHSLPCSTEWSWGCIARLFETYRSILKQKKISRQKHIRQCTLNTSDHTSSALIYMSCASHTRNSLIRTPPAFHNELKFASHVVRWCHSALPPCLPPSSGYSRNTRRKKKVMAKSDPRRSEAPEYSTIVSSWLFPRRNPEGGSSWLGRRTTDW